MNTITTTEPVSFPMPLRSKFMGVIFKNYESSGVFGLRDDVTEAEIVEVAKAEGWERAECFIVKENSNWLIFSYRA